MGPSLWFISVTVVGRYSYAKTANLWYGDKPAHHPLANGLHEPPRTQARGWADMGQSGKLCARLNVGHVVNIP